MPKQSTITFNTLGPNGPALALHLLKQQGWVEQGSLRVVQGAPSVQSSNSDLIVYADGEDVNTNEIPAIFITPDGVEVGLSIGLKPTDVRAFALALLKAADLADEMNGGDDAKKSDV